MGELILAILLILYLIFGYYVADRAGRYMQKLYRNMYRVSSKTRHYDNELL